MAPDPTARFSHSDDQVPVDKEAVVTRFLSKFAELQSRFKKPTDLFESKGKCYLEATISRFVGRMEPIMIVLPGFPTKTPNHGGKVLGPLPDRAEELALARLERFCMSIEEVYPIGCQVTIFSDGRVFGDLVGASLENIRAYKNGLKELVKEAGHTHIQFDGLENYTKTDDPVREVLDRFHIDQMDMDARIANEPDVGNNFRSFSQFMERDMAHRWEGKSEAEMRKGCDEVARNMMLRNVGFSSLVAKEYAHAVRVSIHCYNNAGPKFGIHLLPAKRMDSPRTPWHSVICEDVDGAVHAMDLKDVDTDKYDLVYKHGRKWGYIERPPCTPEETAHWAPLHVELIRTQMFIIAQAMEGFPAPSIMDVPREAIRSLVLKYGVVTLRGFKQDDDFETATECWGDVLQWPKGTFAAGNIFDVKTETDTALTAQTLEAMSFHYDGMFKKKTPESTELGDAPVFMFFHCVEANPPEDDPKSGNTIITDTRRLLSALPEATVERLKTISLEYRTSLFRHHGRVHTTRVVDTHPITGELVLRYHEPWGHEKTKMHLTYVSSVGYDPETN
ncbi:TfdA family Taurine catabolism dioxygenase TauD [Phytophthora infestans]|uniref:Taurine catabolism dioxygenase TauD/TfdA family protein n=1 Tax=Phytophthora infestans TaxID=4787 RepID=A0A833SEG1_PHYIN|nr:TfdA family Taurine catabolism dioxygenase TauD [Phytophthora infestans]KAF4147201.1 Taurine catabolism dioxygenase TauD/TfdA family protein [Phytophthora infestans]